MPKQYSRPERSFVKIVVVLAAMTGSLSSRASHASAPPRVVLVAAAELPAVGERVRAELAAMGFALVLDAAGAELTREGLARVAEARDAVAAVALTFSPAGIELWVVERAKQQTRLRSFVSTAHTSAEPTLVLRIVELLRASLLDIAAGNAPALDAPAPEQQAPGLGMPEPAPQAPVPPAAASGAFAPALSRTPLVPDSSRIATLRLGSGFITSTGGLGTFPSFELAAKLWLTDHLGVELSALAPLARMSQVSREGSSSTRVGALSLAIAASMPLGMSAWVWDIGAGVAGIALQTRGTPASTAYARKENTAVAVAPLLRSGLSYAFTRRLRLGFGARVGAALPRFLIVYAGRTAATWGRPFALAELGLEVDLP